MHVPGLRFRKVSVFENVNIVLTDDDTVLISAGHQATTFDCSYGPRLGQTPVTIYAWDTKPIWSQDQNLKDR